MLRSLFTIRSGLRKRMLSHVEVGRQALIIYSNYTHILRFLWSAKRLCFLAFKLWYTFIGTVGHTISPWGGYILSHTLDYIADVTDGPLWSLCLLQPFCSKPVFCSSHLWCLAGERVGSSQINIHAHACPWPQHSSVLCTGWYKLPRKESWGRLSDVARHICGTQITDTRGSRIVK